MGLQSPASLSVAILAQAEPWAWGTLALTSGAVLNEVLSLLGHQLVGISHSRGQKSLTWHSLRCRNGLSATI